MKLVFWQSIPSAHLIFFMTEIREIRSDYQVVLVVNNLSDGVRESMGWNFYDEYENIEILVAPGKKVVKDILDDPASIHIISGFKGFPAYKIVLQYLLDGRIFGGFLMERPILWGIKGRLRRLFYFRYEGKYASVSQFVFTFGEDACNWYKSVGFAPQRVIPFLYTVNSLNNSNFVIPLYEKSETFFDIIFIGSVIQRKGVDILIRSLARLNKYYKFRLHIIGDGDQRNKVLKLISKLKLTGKVFFYGFQSNEVSRATIAESDLLVLPSRFDGWGAVVNEALTQGVPVVCTSNCGASSLLLDKPQNGEVIDDSEYSLYKALKKRIEQGKIGVVQRQTIVDWAQKSISPHVAAEYFLERLDEIKTDEGYTCNTTAPWD
jgi:glycosyltransferase involved in cell wall biosynthesis